ncbi:MAG TPA: MlaD family protein [Actinomycetota bacterium]|nr:MlaD family protein [Actinomycetota bacterium]
MIRKLALIVGGSLLLGLLGGGLYLGIRAAYGGFDDYLYVTARLPRAGQQVQIGTDVRVRGVNVGKVSDITLDDGDAVLTLQIEEHHEIPETAELVVSLKTLLGSKVVELRFDPRRPARALRDGERIARARVGAELEDALDDGTRLLDAVDAEEVASVIHELAVAGRGSADDIARGLRAQARLSATFAGTLEPQVRALRDFETLFAELEDSGDDLNALADATNEGVPVYASASAQRDMAEALDTLVPFADNLSDILLVERRNLYVMYTAGDRVLGAIAANRAGLTDMVHGLYRYVFKLGGPIGNNLLFDGSAHAGFANFIGGNDQEEEFRQLCSALPPDAREHVPICEDDTR